MEEEERPRREKKKRERNSSSKRSVADEEKDEFDGKGSSERRERRGKETKKTQRAAADAAAPPKGKEKEPIVSITEEERSSHDYGEEHRPAEARVRIPPLNMPTDSSVDPGPTPLSSPSYNISSTSSSQSSSSTPSSTSSQSNAVDPAPVVEHNASRRNMLLKWRTSLRTFLHEVEEDESNEDEYQTHDDFSNRLRIYKRASADYEAQRAGRWSCRVCGFINEVQASTCQVCGRRRRRTTSASNDTVIHDYVEEDEEDEDLPRRNTLTSGCPVAKIANELLLHIFSYLDIREIVSAGSVCRKWRTIADDNHLWNDLILYHASRLLGRWEARRMLEEDDNEDEGSDNVLYYHLDGGRFKAASLDRLLDIITSGDDVDLNEQKAFLVTYPSFTTSELLLTKIIGLYNRVTRRAERTDGDRGKLKRSEEDSPETSRRPVTLCLGTMSLKDSTRNLDEEEQLSSTESEEEDVPMTPRRRVQTINTDKPPENSVWRTGRTDADGKDKAVLYASGNLSSRVRSKPGGSLVVGEARRSGPPLPPPPPPPPPPMIVTVTPKPSNRIKNIIVKPAKQLVSPLTSSSAGTLMTSTASLYSNQDQPASEIETETFAKQVRICSVLKKWVEAHYSELPRGVIDLLLAFVRGRLLRQRHPAYAPLGLSLAMSITRRARLLREGESGYAIFPQLPPEPEVPRNICSPTLSLWDVPPREIARQLTLIEFERFKAIRNSELFGQAWSSARHRHKAKNVVAMINSFNDFCMWVSTTVLSYERIKAQDRVKCIETFAAIAKQLFKLKNFNTLMALLAGLRSGPLYRLAYTRAEVAKRADKIIERLNLLMRSDNAYKTYRDALGQTAPPCIPYLGVHLSDLTFIEDGNPDTIRGLINFTKRRFLFRVISEISRYQQNPYNLHPVPQIQNLLTNLRPMRDDQLYALSLQREPRDAERKDIL